MDQGQAAPQPSVEERLTAYVTNLATEEPEESEEVQPEQTVQEEADVQETETPQENEQDTITLDPEAPLFDVTVKIEGGGNEQKKVSLKDLEAGYMMQADYQRKTAELARARETLTAEVQKMVEPERQSYAQNLQLLHQTVLGLVAPELQNTNWEQLAVENPSEYVKLSAKAQKFQQTLQFIQGQQQQAQAQAFQQAAEHSKKMLADPMQGIPNWGNELYQSLLRYGTDSGFAPEEVANVVDYRMIKVLWKAQKYDELQAAKPNVEKKVTVVPKVLKPGAPVGDLQARKEKELHVQLKKGGGKLEDAAALYMARRKR
jgi:uncharacterized membrane protein